MLEYIVHIQQKLLYIFLIPRKFRKKIEDRTEKLIWRIWYGYIQTFRTIQFYWTSDM